MVCPNGRPFMVTAYGHKPLIDEHEIKGAGGSEEMANLVVCPVKFLRSLLPVGGHVIRKLSQIAYINEKLNCHIS